MGLPQRKLFTKNEYLLLEERAETKHELVSGEIYSMVGAKENHVKITGNIFRNIANHLVKSSCDVYSSDMKLSAGFDCYYPDVFVKCDPDDKNELVTISDLFGDSDLDLSVFNTGTSKIEKKEKEIKIMQPEEKQKDFLKYGYNYDIYLSGYKPGSIGIMKSLMRISNKMNAISSALLVKTAEGFKVGYSLGFDNLSKKALHFAKTDPVYTTLFKNNKIIFIKKQECGIDEFDRKVAREDKLYQNGYIYLPVLFLGKQAYLFFGLKDKENTFSDYITNLYNLV